MLKSKKLFISGACMLAMAGMVAPTAINAQEKAIDQTGETTVTYDNRKVIPDNNAEYGMIIPTAITFREDAQSADASVEITGINGYTLDNWKTLLVKASVKSKNGFLLKDTTDKSAKYSMTVGQTTLDGTTGKGEAEVAVELPEYLGKGADTNDKDSDSDTTEEGEAKLNGTAILGDKSAATVKGQYTDTLTYTFKEYENVKN